MEEIEIKVLNEQEDDVEIKPKTGFACGWGCRSCMYRRNLMPVI